jgi:predicted nucleotidyltransferase
MYTSIEIMKMLKSNLDNIEKFHVSRLGLFGSFTREEQHDASDVDILVEFEDGHESFDNYMDLKFYLEELFERKVDVVIFDSIKPSLKPSIIRSVLYAKGA